MPSVPLVDLAWQHNQIRDEVERGWKEVLDSTSFILGPQVAQFEKEFARFSGVKHCVGVASGTDALELALRSCDIGPGDEVVLPANTFIATALAVTRVGATPVLADCDPDYYVVTPETLAPVVTKDTKAIIPVHLYGQMAPVKEIMDEFPDVMVIEDGAQSQGATRSGDPSGSVGHIAATSFYPGKNIGAYGDGGAVLTNDHGLANQVKKLRNWGSDVKYHHPQKGFNSRLDTLQAVVLSAKLRRLRKWNELRGDAARIYRTLIDIDSVELPTTAPHNLHVWHLYVIQFDRRDEILKTLNEAGVGAGIHYPVPIHLQGAYSDLGKGPGSFPNTETLSDRALSLPMFPGITEMNQEFVVDVLREAVRQ